MGALKFITGHVIYNPAYTYKFQLKTTFDPKKYILTQKCMFVSPLCQLTFKYGHCSAMYTALQCTKRNFCLFFPLKIPLKRRIILIGLFRFYAFFVLVTLRPHNRPSVFDTDYLYSTIYTGYNVHKEKLF